MSNVDKDMNEYLNGDSEYSRRYRALPADDVPPELDRLVLAQAAGANVTSIQAGRKRLVFWRRISVPVTLAASVVLVIALVMQSNVRQDLAPIVQPQAKDESIVVPITPPSARSEPPAPAPAIAEEPAAAPTRTFQVDSETRARAAEAVPEKNAAEKPRAKAEVDQVVVTGQAIQTTVEDAALPVEVIASEDLAELKKEGQRQSTPGGPRAQPVSSARTTNRAAQDTELESIVVTGSYIPQNRSSGAGPRGTVRPAAPAEPNQAELDKQYREADPARWLTYIRELRTAGKSRDADREWRSFVAAYPRYAVDENDAARPPTGR